MFSEYWYSSVNRGVKKLSSESRDAVGFMFTGMGPANAAPIMPFPPTVQNVSVDSSE